MDDTIWLFSYGTLRLPQVQQAVFGRSVAEEVDALPGYRIEMIEITDAATVELSGERHHKILQPTGNPDDRVDGAALAINETDLAAADDYEVDDYRRVEVALASGRRAFVYVGG